MIRDAVRSTLRGCARFLPAALFALPALLLPARPTWAQG
jgi:hypothetical protein